MLVVEGLRFMVFSPLVSLASNVQVRRTKILVDPVFETPILHVEVSTHTESGITPDFLLELASSKIRTILHFVFEFIHGDLARLWMGFPFNHILQPQKNLVRDEIL